MLPTADAAMTAQEPSTSRSVGPLALTFVSVGGVVGSGWLFGPLFAAQLAGPASIIAWVVGGLMVLVTALPFAEVAAMLPVMGGLGRLPQYSHGRTVGMMIGWAAWVGYVTAAPIETQALLEYASTESQFAWLFTGDGSDGDSALSFGGLAVAAVILVVFTVVNAYGVKLFARINTPLTWFKLAVPVIAAVVLLTDFDAANLTSHGFAPGGVHGIMAAISSGGVVFAFLGFRHALDLAGEAHRPQRTVPIALTVSLVICIALFALVQVGFVGAVDEKALEDGWQHLSVSGANGPIVGVLTGLGLVAVANLVLADAVVGPLGAGLVSSASTARLAVAVSRNGLFPTGLQQLSRHLVPLRALVLNMVVGMAILLFFRNGWSELLTFSAGAIVLSFAVGPVTLLAMRRRLPDRARPFRLPAVQVVGYASFVIVGLIIYWSGWDTLWRLSIPMGVGALLLLWRVLRQPGARDRLDLRQAAWLVPFYLGLLAISFAGRFGGGREWIPLGWDLVAVTALAVVVLPYAVRSSLSEERMTAYIEQDDEVRSAT